MNIKNSKEDALSYHSQDPKGKIEVTPTKPVSSQSDLALAYSPGVAVPCLEIAENKEALSQTLEGKSFVISGVFENYSRDELKSIIEQHGGRNSGSISSKTDYILAGANMGPSKYEKAKNLGITILTESAFMSMLS